MHMNDYELLYLIYEKNDFALEIMYEKYAPLIHARIRDFRIQRNKEDFFQEGLLVLNKAINRFNMNYNKTFTKYFDLILQRRFIQILRKEKNYFYNQVLLDDVDFIVEEEEEVYQERPSSFGFFSKLENDIYYLSVIEKRKAKVIANQLSMDIRIVYNTLGRIRKKLRDKAIL